MESVNPARGAGDPRRATVMWTMAVDAVTAEVVSALDEAGVDSLLLKGPTVADWLYDGDSRSYVDTDLLVDPDQLPRAQATLKKLGFEENFGPLPHPGMERPPSAEWQRDAFQIDLHEALDGAEADPKRVWALLWARRTEHTVGGRQVPALDLSARLVHIALHAAHHGPGAEKPVGDLRQALFHLGDADWADAYRTAEAMKASYAFAAGVGLVPEGCAVLERLGIGSRPRPGWVLEAGDVPIAPGIERLRLARGLGAKARMVGHELVPSREFMRWWSPVARRSSVGLLAAYVWRWIYLARHAPQAILAWRRATHTRE